MSDDGLASGLKPGAASAGSIPTLDAEGVSKRFGAVVALADASLRVAKGEVVALMGANGAGKSTFVKILTGALRADGGAMRIRGHALRAASPGAARRSGLVPVYQEPSLIPDLDLRDNLRLGAIPVEAFQHWTDAMGLAGLRLDEPAGHLPLATMRVVDLARALAGEPEVLLLDEMTAALPADLVRRVLTVVREQADAGRSIVYVSHRFAEIAEICDSATVLRDGRTVGSLPIVPGVEEKIIALMLGDRLPTAREVRARTAVPRTDVSPTEVPRLRVANLGAGRKLTDVSFEARRGEVLGIVALEGQGQDELFDVLAGFLKPSAGSVEIDGVPARFSHPADAIRAGHSFVPGNRADALMMQQSVRDNIALPFSARIARWGRVDLKREAARVADAIARLQIDTRAQGEVRRLSGGNQQKVTIGRWLATGVETLLLFDPTRGIDVRTKRQIYPLVRELADKGALVVFYTSELEEVRLACDRAVVIFNGKVVDIIDAADADDPTLMRAAYGLTAAAEPAL